MKYDKSKVKTGSVYPIKDKYLVFAGGYLRISTEGITCFQDITPYNQTSGDAIPHAYPGHGGVDVRAAIGTPVYAEKDCTIKTGNDDYGNKVICNGRRMRHMNNLPTKTSFKKGEIVFYTGDDNTNAPHLHIGREDGGDEFATMVEGKPTSSSSSRYKLNQYYYNGWHKDTSIPFYNDDKLLVVETNTAKYGSGVYRLTQDSQNWEVNTRFKK